MKPAHQEASGRFSFSLNISTTDPKSSLTLRPLDCGHCGEHPALSVRHARRRRSTSGYRRSGWTRQSRSDPEAHQPVGRNLSSRVVRYCGRAWRQPARLVSGLSQLAVQVSALRPPVAGDPQLSFSVMQGAGLALAIAAAVGEIWYPPRALGRRADVVAMRCSTGRVVGFERCERGESRPTEPRHAGVSQ